jgi:PAS domain S-box-containing protein
VEQEVGQGSGPALRAVAESIDDAVVSADGGSRIVYWNPAAERMFGWTADEAIGRSLTTLMPERYRRAHLAGMARFRETGVPHVAGKGAVELAGLHKDGHEFSLELTIGAWEGRDGHWYTGVLRDITERKRAQAQLAAALSALERRREHERQAAEWHDNVIQSIAVAKYALGQGDPARAGEAIDRALAVAREMVDELLASSPLAPGDLRRPAEDQPPPSR